MSLTLARRGLAALRTLIDLDGATPDTDQARTLAGWPGWGVLAPALGATAQGSWADVADELESILGDHPDWLVSGRDATDTSFYTPSWLAQAMADVARRVGFTSGEVADLGCGSGVLMSADLPGAEWTGVEIDPVSARLAQALNPGASILNLALEKTALGADRFDVVIANVPFSSVAPFDPDLRASNLHTYFLLRALQIVRPGGYVIALTSRHVMDSNHDLAALLRRADLAGAVRLPTGTFQGTQVVADLLVLRKVAEREIPQDLGELALGHSSRAATILGQGWNALRLSPYWSAFPEHVAGRMEQTGFDRCPLRLVSGDVEADTLAALESATRTLIPIPAREAVEPLSLEDVQLEDSQGRKEGSLHLTEDGVVRITDGRAEPVDRPAKELISLIELRDLTLELLAVDAEHSHLPIDADDHAPLLRARALKAYQSYLARHGALGRGTLHQGKDDPDTGAPTYTWRRPSLGGFRSDPDYMTVLAVEVFDPDTDTAHPAPILLRPVNRAPRPITRADSPADALAITLGETRRVDTTRIAGLLGLSTEEEAVSALGDLVFTDPATGDLIAARDYLSGDVPAKLAQATRAARLNPALERNRDALAAVMPEQAGPAQITPTLGAPWIGPEIVESFTEEVLGTRLRITHTPSVAAWEVSTWYGRTGAGFEYATSDRDPAQILEAILNGRTIVVQADVFIPGIGYRKMKDPEATMAAESAASAMRAAFAEWAFLDPERTAALVAEYNRRFRSYVTPTYDGSAVSIPGLACDVTMWDHQCSIVERIASSPRVLCGHAVGSGKTRSMLATAVYLRSMGLANRPMIVVPGHILEQIAREAIQTFPAARFLVAGKEDLARSGRHLFAARCATGDWDAVIVTHEVFGSIPVSARAEEDYLMERQGELVDALRGSEQAYGKAAKKVAAAKKKVTAEIAALRHRAIERDPLLFEHLGVDFLAVDEVHYFRRLASSTRSDGFSLGTSKRATDLHLKVEMLGRARGDRPHFAGFTGTVWSNTLAETFVWQRFFDPAALRRAQLDSFEAWSAMFVDFTDAVEVAPDGSGFRLNRRPSGVRNVHALMGMVLRFCDILPAGTLDADRPEGRWHTVTSPMGPEQQDYVSDLVARADAIRNGGAAGKDNMLAICNDGRRLALDPALVGLDATSAKALTVADHVAARFHETADLTLPGAPTPGAFQLLLCDQGTPGAAGSQTYGRLRAALIDRGIPAQKVRFIHEAKNDKARAAMFAACRTGEVAVLIGSTPKVGVGANIQTRLVALHHIDAPWRPSDVEQREGRGLRPGNLAPWVDIYRYVTEGSFDAYMWQALERKARAFDALANLRATEAGDLEDVGEVVLSYGEVKAAAAGDARLIEHADLTARARRLRILRGQRTKQSDQLRRHSTELLSIAESCRTRARHARALPDSALSAVTDGAVRRLPIVLTGGHSIASITAGPVQVRLERLRAGAVQLDLLASVSMSPLTRLVFSAKELRREPETAVTDAITRWWTNREAWAKAQDIEAEQCLTDSAQAMTNSTEAAVFPQQSELDEVIVRLSELDEQFAHEADPANRALVAV